MQPHTATEPKLRNSAPYPGKQSSAKARSNRAVIRHYSWVRADTTAAALVLDTEDLNTTRALLQSGHVSRVTVVQEDPRVAATTQANVVAWGLNDCVTVVVGDVFDYMRCAAAARDNYGCVYIDAEGYGGDMAGRYNPAKYERDDRRYVGDVIAAFVANCSVRCFALTSTMRARGAKGAKSRTRAQRVADIRRCLGAYLPAHEYAVGYQAVKKCPQMPKGSQYMALDIYTCRPAGMPTVYRTKARLTAVNPRDGNTYVQRVGYGRRDRNRVYKPEYVMRVPPGARVGKYVAHVAGDVFAQCLDVK